ncbi:MAG: glycosyltransferase [Acidimicrobiia bacterium]|nr:glycosyltransferase [Acidimicrobiia bacterium]
MKHNSIRPTIGFLSTYPPTSCGLATFTRSLLRAVAEDRGTAEGLGVVSLVDEQQLDGSDGASMPEVVHEHVNGDPVSLTSAIKALNSFDVASIQHEYGIFGGQDGNEVLDILGGLEVPAIVTLHTVLSQPTLGQRSILRQLVAMAERTVVMSETAYSRLLSEYSVDASKIRVIPHGANLNIQDDTQEKDERPSILTWGLIGPGKGLEMAIDAFVGLDDIDPLPRYIIQGKTHPKVRASQGTAYLDGLVARVQDLGLENIVEFDNRYLESDELAAEVRRADMVVLPYESTEQVTSGVLVEALAAGKPVIATEFPHAVEMLSTGAGITVPHDQPGAMSSALRRVLTYPVLANRMAREARRIGMTLHWPTIGRRYDNLATKLVSRPMTTRQVSYGRRLRTSPDAVTQAG